MMLSKKRQKKAGSKSVTFHEWMRLPPSDPILKKLPDIRGKSLLITCKILKAEDHIHSVAYTIQLEVDKFRKPRARQLGRGSADEEDQSVINWAVRGYSHTTCLKSSPVTKAKFFFTYQIELQRRSSNVGPLF